MDKQFLEGKFNEVSGALKQKFSNLNLSDEELKKAMSSPDELVNLVSQKTGLPPEEARQKVHQALDTLHISDEQAKGFMAKFADKVESKYAEFKNKLTH
ncbi:hypothetical protein [Bdellovibrio sp. BCCA]|uniref:hypothetical protein n=1 Tax=Bdellovibrio sp. BCCA TaxID=3136281 RepID=UPI0030F2A392